MNEGFFLLYFPVTERLERCRIRISSFSFPTSSVGILLAVTAKKLPLTPNLDKMAAEGVRFEHAFSCQPVCGPTRAALQTGKWPTEIGCFTNHRRLPADEKTIANWFGEAGYEAGYIGKWHLASCGPKDGPDDFRTKIGSAPSGGGGYQDFWLASDVLEFTSHSYDGHMFNADGSKREFPEGRYRVDAQTDWVLEYLRDARAISRFFCLSHTLNLTIRTTIIATKALSVRMSAGRIMKCPATW